MAAKALEHLGAIERVLGRLLELQQSPRVNFLAAGTVAGGGNASTAPMPIIAAEPHRRGLSIQNIAAAGTLTVGLGVTSPIPGQGLTLAAGASWDGRISGAVWSGSVSIVASQPGVAYSWLVVPGPSGHRNEAL